MIGFDRPLRPEWIYKSLQMWTSLTPIQDYYEKFNKITYELYGKEGKRKARTVLFRYFFELKGYPPNQTTGEKSILAQFSKRLDLEDLKPMYITALLMRAETLQVILKTLIRLYPTGSIESRQVIEKSIGLFGERDVVKRSTRSFLTTLVYFDIMNRDGINYSWKRKLPCSTKQLAYLIAFYSKETGSFELHLDDIRNDCRLALLDLSNLESSVIQYNSKLWTYIRRPSVAKIILDPKINDIIMKLE
jgi:hypothetical protein